VVISENKKAACPAALQYKNPMKKIVII